MRSTTGEPTLQIGVTATPLDVVVFIPRDGFLTFDLRTSPGNDGPTAGPDAGGLPIAVRVVDAHLTHWRYVPGHWRRI